MLQGCHSRMPFKAWALSAMASSTIAPSEFWRAFTATADFQPITNPAYNADRGPVSIFSGRSHGGF